MPAVLADKTLDLLELLPPFLAGARDAQSVIDALAREVSRLDAAKDELVANLFPQTADKYLSAWESLLGLSIEAPDKTLAQRRTTVVSFLQSTTTSGSGLSWEANLTRLIGTSWTYLEYDPANPAAVPPFTIRVTIPFGSALSAPAGLAATPAATGGTLAAGTYVYAVTAVNAYGETIPSSTVSATTTGATGSVALAWGAVTNAVSYRVYRGASPSTLRLLGTATAASFSDTGAATGAAPPPVTNTTNSPQAYEARALARQITPAHIDLIFGYGVGFIVGISQVGFEPL